VNRQTQLGCGFGALRIHLPGNHLLACCSLIVAYHVGRRRRSAVSAGRSQSDGAASGSTCFRAREPSTTDECACGRPPWRDRRSRETHILSVSGGNLHVWNVSSGCLGLINTGDPSSFVGKYTIKPPQTITSP